MLPTGTITFLFTDIEGSTQRWDRDRVAMQDAVRRHDAIMRAAIEAYNGYVFKTIGDAFCAAFSTAAEAVAMTVLAQRALATEDFTAVDGLRVRMALNTGTADERDGDYYGPTLNRVARLLSIGHGGQVLLTKDTLLAAGAMPAGVEVRDMGPQRLKDLAEPEHVHQILIDGLKRDFAALKSVGTTPNNLPAQLSSFVGREAESAEVTALLQANRLVTLLGTGGIGKTRLSLHVADGLLGRFPDGVWVVEFAPVAEGALVPETIAAVLSVPEAPGRSAIDGVVENLKHETALLVLDNCEHLVQDVAKAMEAILRGCPHVKILASTRELIGVPGEQPYRMPTLGLPSADEIKTLTAEKALRFGALALFADRAKTANAQFAVTDDNARILGDICRRLDGIALAIELAAARVKMLSVKSLSEKLDERFRVLTGGSRTALPRQQTLRALIDWSYDLLSETERSLFRRLSVFAGGFLLEMIGALCDDSVADFEAMDLLAQLVDKSLVVADLSEEEPRYTLLESIRVYAREKLEESGERDTFVRAHAVAFGELAERLSRDWLTMSESQWKATAQPEMENWRAALHWAFGDGGDVELGQRLTASLRPVFAAYGISEGRRWTASALETSPSGANEARLALASAHLSILVMQGQDALAAGRRAIDGFEKFPDDFLAAQARMFTGAALGMLGEPDAAGTLLEEALASFRALGARRAIGAALQLLAQVRWGAGDAAGTRPLLSEALSILKDTPGAERPAAHIALLLAEVEFQSGNTERALQLSLEALETDRALHNEDGVVFDLCNIAAYLRVLGRLDDALARAREGLALAYEGSIEAGVFVSLQRLAAVAAMRPERAGEETLQRAARIMGFVDSRFAAIGMVRDFTEKQEYDGTIGSLERLLGGAELARLMTEGGMWNAEFAMNEAAAM